jgi:chaperonin GroES
MSNSTATSVKPLGNRVVLKRSEPKASRGGILLPETAKEKPKQGVVLAVGPGKRDEDGRLQPMQVQVGDEVLFSAYGGVELTLNGEEVLVISEEDLLAVIGNR